jgi:hypothetical protein
MVVSTELKHFPYFVLIKGEHSSTGDVIWKIGRSGLQEKGKKTSKASEGKEWHTSSE